MSAGDILLSAGRIYSSRRVIGMFRASRCINAGLFPRGAARPGYNKKRPGICRAAGWFVISRGTGS